MGGRSLSPQKVAFLWLLLNEKRLTVTEIARKLKITRSCVYKYKYRGIFNAENKKNHKGGRPKKINERDMRNLVRCLKSLRERDGAFTSRRLAKDAGIDAKNVSMRTVRRAMNDAGYRYLQARKKGILNKTDLKKRLSFAKKMKKEYCNTVWREDINFFLDGVSFAYKRNPFDQGSSPKGRIWRKPCEGLDYGCTAKGKKEGSGGKLVKLMVAISYGKGVIDCEQYDKMSGFYFKDYITRKFPVLFEKADKLHSRLWIQDGCPCQNSKAAKIAMNESGACLLSIPPRSPDINPIENLFHLVRKELDRQAIAENKVSETYNEFANRVINTFKSFPTQTVDNIIESMDKRMNSIISRKGQRINY